MVSLECSKPSKEDIQTKLHKFIDSVKHLNDNNNNPFKFGILAQKWIFHLDLLSKNHF